MTSGGIYGLASISEEAYQHSLFQEKGWYRINYKLA